MRSSRQAGQLCSPRAAPPRGEALHTATPPPCLRPSTEPLPSRKQAAAPWRGPRSSSCKARHGAARPAETRPLRPPPPTAPAPLTLPRPWRSRWVMSPPGFLLQIQTQAAPVSGADRTGTPARPPPAAMPRRRRGFSTIGPRAIPILTPAAPPAAREREGGPSASRFYRIRGPQPA